MEARHLDITSVGIVAGGIGLVSSPIAISADFNAGEFDGNNAMVVNGGVIENRSNTDLVSLVGKDGSRGLVFDFDGQTGEGDSWAELRVYPFTHIGTEFWVEWDLWIDGDTVIPTRNNDKLLRAWHSGPNRNIDDKENYILVAVEFVPENYSMSGNLVSPSTPGWYPRVSEARGDPCETRLPDHHETWGIYAPLFTSAHFGTWIKPRIHVRAKYQDSLIRVWRDSTLCAETIAEDYSIICPVWAGQVFNQLYLHGYANSGILGQWVVDNLKIYTSDPGWS